jgi:hypothetical protein
MVRAFLSDYGLVFLTPVQFSGTSRLDEWGLSYVAYWQVLTARTTVSNNSRWLTIGMVSYIVLET